MLYVPPKSIFSWDIQGEKIYKVRSLNSIPSVGLGHNEGEDKEDEEGGDVGGHDEDVGDKEVLAILVGANEAGNGDEEEEGPAGQVVAGDVGSRGDLDAADDYGEEEDKGEEVQERDYVVAHRHLIWFVDGGGILGD
ncbi:uncharacterized protein A4U43_C02F19450 [Asparagus officinalis]|uniref:Uncharacterized protein n=1 Tax=Asparagus officinalis TaxID=4686 RepID=A0A5P1FK67_ASPOF|nr:uncharacterized protein A4U43_C02F19450 [Asparagus officinalis]